MVGCDTWKPGLWSTLAALVGCGPAPAETLPRQALMEPETCTECHAGHVREWRSSMHAYAVDDPVFVAMNARGQEETDGELGDFCVGCHAPLAVREGFTDDGMNLDELPEELRGVTCYFCHTAASISEQHDNPLGLPANNPLLPGDPVTMLGGLHGAKRPSAHDVAYSPLHDGDRVESGAFCGGCHDIVTDRGVHLERTFQEWERSFIGSPELRNPPPEDIESERQTCIECHMDARDGLAAETDEFPTEARTRGVHSHMTPGIDTALTDWPDVDIQVKAIECLMRAGVKLRIYPHPVTPEVELEAEVGHHFPTGASLDRRFWVEVTAWNAEGEVVLEEGKLQSPSDPEPDTFMLRDHALGAGGQEVHMFWEAAPSADNEKGFTANTVPAQGPDVFDHTLRISEYRTRAEPARIEARLMMRPVGHDVLDDLLRSGHLSANQVGDMKARMRTLSPASTRVVWEANAEDKWKEVEKPRGRPLDCDAHWLCDLYPERTECAP